MVVDAHVDAACIFRDGIAEQDVYKRQVWDCVKSFLQHGSDHTEHRMLRNRVAYKILAAQIENWRQVQLLAEQGEL